MARRTTEEGADPVRRLELLEERFHRFVGLPEDERRAALSEVEADDPKLARELAALLAADAGGTVFGLASDGASGAEPGELLDADGRYRLLRQIGEGGMAAVWEAEQLEPLRRRVAVKLLRGHWLEGSRLVRRFEVEKATLAQLEHPNIARVFDAGLTRWGLPFFTMELVDGEPIDRFSDRLGLDLEARVSLLREVCRAVRHAHERQIVHRDLKPSNLLVSRMGSETVVKVIDFGIAKTLDRSLDGEDLTRTGELVGTPSFMSPEQIRGDPIDARSDVFSLGVVLYELAAGSSPFRGDDRGGSDPRFEGAPAPSRWLTTPRAAASLPVGTSPRELRRKLRGRLDRIVLRATATRPQDRYADAGELERDLGRFLEGGGVSAPSAPVLAVRRWKRDAGPFTWLSTAAVLAVLAVLGWSLQSRLAMGSGATDEPVSVSSGAAATRLSTLAVLPLDAGPTEAARRTAHELTDSLSSTLARLSGLRVTAPESAAEAVGISPELASVSRLLDVENVVRGRVDETSRGFVVEIELTGAAAPQPTWDHRIEVEPRELWTLPVDLALGIADRLAVAPSSGAWAPRVASPRLGREAIDAYLRGRFFWGRRTREDFDLAERHFRTAIAAEPEFALAHAGLADTEIIRALYGYAEPAEAFARAAIHAERSLALAPDAAESLTAQAAIDLFYHWDLTQALAGFERAIVVGPSFATARLGYADVLLAMGRFEEALEQSAMAVAISPFDRGLNRAHADFLATAGRLEEALAQIDHTLEMAPQFADALLLGAEIEGMLGRGEGVGSRLRAAVEAGASPTAVALSEAAALAWLGDASSARRLLAELAPGDEVGAFEAYRLAGVHALAGDRESAYRFLDRAVAARSPSIVYLGVSPAVDSLRSEPRFERLLERVGLRR